MVLIYYLVRRHENSSVWKIRQYEVSSAKLSLKSVTKIRKLVSTKIRQNENSSVKKFHHSLIIQPHNFSLGPLSHPKVPQSLKIF